MEQSDQPLGLALSEGLGPLPEDALRQQAFVILSRLQSGTEDVVRLDAALAAVAAERERIAQHFDARDRVPDGKPMGIGFYDPHEPAEIIRAFGPNVDIRKGLKWKSTSLPSKRLPKTSRP